LQTLAAASAALLQERDGSGIFRDPDFRLRLEQIRSGRGGTDSWRRAVETEMGRILRRLPASEGAYGWTGEQEDRVGSLLAGAFPDRLARREPDGSYRLVTGRIARFPGSGSVTTAHAAMPSRAAGPWVVALDADPGESTGTIRLAAPVEGDEAEQALAFAAEETEEIRWEGLVPKGAVVRRAGRLVLTERPSRPVPEEVLSSFLQMLRQRGPALLPWNAQSTRLLSRMRFYARARPDLGAGDLSDSGLSERAAEWLVPCLKLNGGHVITAGGLFSALKTLASGLGGRMGVDVPESVNLPTGGKRAIDYEGSEPSVEARIQEVFGMARSPMICGVPLTFRLLSPARRPLQITRDLESFWRVTYAEVRKEMRGRYPKHYWPEDPRTAQPTSRVRPKG
jgi:ATP-dependent helicase HrpB